MTRVICYLSLIYLAGGVLTFGRESDVGRSVSLTQKFEKLKEIRMKADGTRAGFPAHGIPGASPFGFGKHLSKLQGKRVLARKFGAKGDGETLDTEAIQKAIDACSEMGGGQVLLDGGIYLSGSLQLKEGVTLHVGRMGVLRADDSSVAGDSPYLIRASGVSRVALAGEGTIEGLGWRAQGGNWELLSFENCREVVIEDLFLLHPGGRSIALRACSAVRISDIVVRGNPETGGEEGILVDSCEEIVLENGNFLQGGSGVSFAASVNGKKCRDVKIWDSIFATMPVEPGEGGNFEEVKVIACVEYNPKILSSPSRVFDPREYGARGDGKKLDTGAIQKAIDACGAAGGGRVLLEKGIFRSGTLFLRSEVELHVAASAILRGSENLSDYQIISTKVSHMYSQDQEGYFTTLLYAEGEENISLTGNGVIDGQGSLFLKKAWAERPFMLRFARCQSPKVLDLCFFDSINWLLDFMTCDDVLVEGVTIRNRNRENRDGVDLDGCDGVVVRYCDAFTGDDGIVVKSTVADRPSRNLLIHDCVVSALPGALKLGTESYAGFQNVTYRDSVIYNARDGIVITNVDGGESHDITFSNIRMRNVSAPIFVRQGNRLRPVPGEEPRPGAGYLKNLVLRDIRVEGGGRIGSSFVGVAGHPISNISLENVQITTLGGGTKKEAERIVPLVGAKYPRGTMFGVLPASGIYFRDVEGVVLNGVSVKSLAEDARPALVVDGEAGVVKIKNGTPEPRYRAKGAD